VKSIFMKKRFQGAGVALLTPFKEDLTIDFPALGNLVDYLVENGTDFLVVLGTTAETATLTSEEKQEIIDFVAKQVQGRIPIIVGVGGNNTQSVIDSFKHMDLSKADAILSVVPYYNKPTQEGIFQHFMAIEKASPLPILLYNVPGRTAINMTAETTLRLANASDKFIGTKEASGNLAEISKIIRDKPEDFIVLSGDDCLTLPIMSVGGEGVISVAGNVVPRMISDLTNSALKGDYATAGSIHLKLLTLFDALFVEGNPAGAKAALNSIRMVKNQLRLPLVPVSQKTFGILSKEMQELITNYELRITN
jgi:4-hydroxy-tetrahydrodipicolinate synthase